MSKPNQREMQLGVQARCDTAGDDEFEYARMFAAYRVELDAGHEAELAIIRAENALLRQGRDKLQAASDQERDLLAAVDRLSGELAAVKAELATVKGMQSFQSIVHGIEEKSQLHAIATEQLAANDKLRADLRTCKAALARVAALPDRWLRIAESFNGTEYHRGCAVQYRLCASEVATLLSPLDAEAFARWVLGEAAAILDTAARVLEERDEGDSLIAEFARCALPSLRAFAHDYAALKGKVTP